VLAKVVDEAQAERLLDDLRRGRVQSPRGVGVRTLLRSDSAPALLVGVTLAALQQFAGINAVIAYAPSIMERTGLSASNSILYSIANVAATVVAVRLVDRRGRRRLLLASTAGTGAALVVLDAAFELPLGDWGSRLSLIGLLACVVGFAVGLGPIFWRLMAEIFPAEARGAGAGVSTAVNCVLELRRRAAVRAARRRGRAGADVLDLRRRLRGRRGVRQALRAGDAGGVRSPTSRPTCTRGSSAQMSMNPRGDTPRGARHPVVVVGGGFAGIEAVKGLRAVAVEVTLVDRHDYHLFQPLTYKVASGTLSPDEIAVPLRAIFQRQRRVRVVMAEATGIDLERRRLIL
jgi:hypothetical protein